MRSQYVIKNICMGIFSQLVIVLLGFISRKVFLDSLGAEYLGINGLLTNILSSMVLIEGGIGVSIVYNLYKPLAQEDKSQVIALVQLYKKCYQVLTLIIFIICFILYLFLPTLLKTEDEIPYLSLVYWILVFKSLISYFVAYKVALINADQRGYILTKYNLIFQAFIMIGKIIILSVFKNYILFLLIEVIVLGIQNIFNCYVINKLYPYINTKKRYYIDDEVKSNIQTNVKAMFIQNLGSYAIYSTDNIIISTFINVASIGLYSNYTMIISQLSALISPIIGGIGNSVGNLIATESSNKTYEIFKITNLVCFFIYSICTISLYNLLETFISWWIGDEYLLPHFTLIVILVNFYISGLRTPINTFKSKAGLFAQDKYANLVEGILNLFFSIWLINYFALAGVFLGTTISFILVSFWNQPRILFKKYFQLSPLTYFKDYFIKLGLCLLVLTITTSICQLITCSSLILLFIIRGMICVSVPSIIYLVLFCRSLEVKYLLNMIYNRIPSSIKKAFI